MKIKITLLLLVISLSSVFGQVKESEIISRDSKGHAKIIKLNETKISDDIGSIRGFLKKQYKANPSIKFKRKISPRSKSGLKIETLQQYYEGIKVQFAILNVTSKNGKLESVNGNFVHISNLNTTPRLSENKALQIVLKEIGAQEYAWENKEKEALIKRLEKSETATYYPEGELVIIEKNRYSENPVPTLAYKFDVYATNPISRKFYYVDADSGEIFFKNPIIKHIDGVAETKYSGQRTIETEYVNGQYRLRDNTRGDGISTYNIYNLTFHQNNDYWDNDNNWTMAEHDNATMDIAALDAHWGAMMTYDYFLEIQDINSIDNEGYELINYVNADLSGWGFPNDDNAFWDGSVMTYGMGTYWDPLVSVDIIAHEIGHGLYDKMVGSVDYSREQGAINEGLSDIWGAMVEYFAAPEKDTYLMGEDIGNVARSMANPKLKGDPNTYGGDFWQEPNCGIPSGNNDFCGVHNNSGVLNYWFYLLAEGSAATDGINDHGDPFSFSGIGKLKASKIVFWAETVYFTPTTNYQDARTLTILAAEDLYGAGSVESLTVCQSWYAVGVGDNNCNQNHEITGDETICGTQNSTYTLNFTPTTINWAVSPDLQIISSNNISVTVQPTNSYASGQGYVEAILPNETIRKDIWIGKPRLGGRLSNGDYLSYGFADNDVCNYEQIVVDMNLGGANNANWSLINSSFTLLWSQQGNNLSFYFSNVGQTATFRLTTSNECGTISRDYSFISEDCSGGDDDPCAPTFTVFPNPADTEIKINSIEAPCGNPILPFDNNAISKATLYDFSGNPILKRTPANGTLDVSQLNPGHYILVISSGNKKTTHRIIIN